MKLLHCSPFTVVFTPQTRRPAFFSIGFFLLLFLSGCSNIANDIFEPFRLTEYWKTVNWRNADNGAYANFTYNNMSPYCSDAPFSTSNHFYFSVKEGSSQNIVIFFEGGGACWHSNNCLASNLLFTSEIWFDMKTKYLNRIANQTIDARSLGFGGIFNFQRAANPFKNYTFIYIPYCTGDLHLGANNHSYVDSSNNTHKILHHGHVNFEVVMEWMQNHYPDPIKIVTMGSSAGGYGAIFNFPFIENRFPSAQHAVIIDSAGGVIGGNLQTSGMGNWNIQLPNSTTIPGTSFTAFDGANPTDPLSLDLTTIVATIANAYPSVDFGQYNTAWDKLQVEFYDMMLDILTPASWFQINNTEYCNWHNQLYSNLNYSLGATSNYSYFLAPGKTHTVLKYNRYYTIGSAGTLFYDWVNLVTNAMVPMQTIDCRLGSNCQIPSGITCP